ncbi:sugar ABC transporter [Synechococcus sp. M16CYN]|uniref:sugar ABC transporter n=1 Tax=Synechococcus sp. M16CYN TaxID=3103139 RepID=UPI00324BE4E7
MSYQLSNIQNLASFNLEKKIISNIWTKKLLLLKKPRVLILLFLASSAFYCFIIGRDRYSSISEFVIQQAIPLNSSSASISAEAAATPQVLTSLIDGQYLQVYLASADVKKRLFPNPKILEHNYKPSLPDFFSGLSQDSNQVEQLNFYRRQLTVTPQPLSGSVILTTYGFTPKHALNLNNSLLLESRRFINEVNQSISADQTIFAEKEVRLARKNLKIANEEFENFQDKYGQLSIIAEQKATNSLIAGLEERLVALKVEEAALRRQYRDPSAPEILFIADQASELAKQIKSERNKSVSSNGKDLNNLALKEASLLSNVAFATKAFEAARLAADNSRRESQRQLKFVIVLSQPQLATSPDQNWRWQAFLGSIGIVVVAWGVGGFILTTINKA